MKCACGTDNPSGFRICRGCGASLAAQIAAVPVTARPAVLGLEIVMQCAGCFHPIAVNALTPRITCSRCSRPNDLQLGDWEAIFRAVALAVPGPEPGARGEIPLRRTTQTNVTYTTLAAPSCAGCQAELSAQAAFEQARTTSGWAGCSRCRAWLLVRAPADVLPQVAPGAVCLIGEDPAHLPGAPTEMSRPAGARPVVFPCPKCGATLDVDGSSRMIVCKFCSVSAYLPDDLWQQLHPAPRPKRWYAVYR